MGLATTDDLVRLIKVKLCDLEFGLEIIQALHRGAQNKPPAFKPLERFRPELEATVDFLSLCLRVVAREKSWSL